MMNDVLLSVGSNIEPRLNFRRSLAILAREQILIDTSRVIFTKPVGYKHQPDFLNAAFYLKTAMDYASFNQSLKWIEKRLGRVKTPIKSGPRTIDLDIIAWNHRIVRDEYYYYDYVKRPICELTTKHGIHLQPLEIVREPVAAAPLPV